MLNFKKRPTYLPKLKLMGRSMANKYILRMASGLVGLQRNYVTNHTHF